MMRLNVKASALAAGIVFGLGIFLLTWWLIVFAEPEANTAALISQVYLGYSISLVGSFVGLFWGFIDGLFGGFFFAWIYNAIAKRISDDEQA
jgi:hypothetical protein